jgi:ABC-type branched-subunit amino acid transport system substrate-binding protein
MKRKHFILMAIAVIVFAGVSTTSLYAADNIKIAKIGFEGEMTGPLSMYGQPLAHGHQFAIDYLNKVLFPKGMPIGKDLYHFELVVEDDGSNPSEAPLAAQRLLDKGIFAMITVLGSWIEPVYPKLAEMKVPMITNSPFMTEKLEDPWIYRYRNTPTQVMPAVAAYIKTKFGPKRATVLSETGSMGTPGGQMWVDAAVKAGGIPRDQIEWQQYKAGIQGNEWLPYLTKATAWKSDVIFHGATGEWSGTPQACDIYLQAKELGYKGYFGSYTGMTDVQSRAILGPNYASYLGNVYQGEGVDAFTSPDPKVRKWGREYFDKYKEYPIDMIPWAWDEIMLFVSAAQMAGTVTDGDKINKALAEMPFKFPLSKELKTPMSPLRGDKMWDEKGQALMEVMVAGWTKDGVKVPAAIMLVDESGKILRTTYPTPEVIKELTAEYKDRMKQK